MKKRFFWSWSLGARLIFIFILLNIIAPALALIFASQGINTAAANRISAQLEDSVRLSARGVADYLSQQIATLRVIAVSQNVIATVQISNTAFDDFNEPVEDVIAGREIRWAEDEAFVDGILASPISQELMRYQAQLAQIQELHVMNFYGATIAASSRDVEYSEGGEAWYQVLITTGEIQILQPALDEESGRWGMEIAVPIRSRADNSLIGAVSMVLDYADLQAHLASGVSSTEVTTYIISSIGLGVIVPSTDQIAQPYAAGGSIADEDGSTLNAVNRSGEKIALAYSPVSTDGQIPEIDGLGWTATLEQKLSLAYALVNDVRIIVALILIVPVVLVLTAFFFVTRALTRELVRMGAGAIQFSEGQYDTRMRLHHHNPPELTRLAMSFNTMAERVQVTTKQLTEAEALSRSQNQALVKANNSLAVARRQAEESTRVKSEFLATMSHELRTPLNAIIGYTEIQLAGMTGDLTSEQTDYQNRVLRNANHLLELINDILDLSKIEAGRIEVVSQPFRPGDLLNEIGYQTGSLFTSKPIKYTASIDPTLPQTVLGDYGRLKQIIINLVSNAAKFTESGEVDLMFARQDDQWWRITVRDTGVGIPSHAQEYIFEEFRQADGSMQRQHQGTGLGLAIVRKLVLLMSGRITLKSKVGEGSEFTITLPLVTESMSEAVNE